MFENKPYELYHGDCLEVMDKLIEQDIKVDMVLCDLPYGTTKCKWDSTISLNGLWEKYLKLIKPDGYIVLFSQTPFDKELGHSNINMLKYEWIWIKDKPTGHLNANYAPMKAHENILVFTNDNTSYTKSNPNNGYRIGDLLTKVEKTISRTNKHGIYDVGVKNASKQKFTGYPNDLLYFSSDKESYHPTQKPVKLLEFLIKRYTDENMIVLDNTMGSGSTCVACMNIGRKFIGIELDDTYFEIAEKRIAKSFANKWS